MVQGRVGASQDCQCVYADGERNNDDAANTPLDGWAKVDPTGLHCYASPFGGPRPVGQQSYNSGPGQSCI